LDTLDVTFLIEFATFEVAFLTFVIGASIKDEIVFNGGELDAFVFRLILIDISIEYLVRDLYKQCDLQSVFNRTISSTHVNVITLMGSSAHAS
jgi:hypothetical protein